MLHCRHFDKATYTILLWQFSVQISKWGGEPCKSTRQYSLLVGQFLLLSAVMPTLKIQHRRRGGKKKNQYDKQFISSIEGALGKSDWTEYEAS